jgi:hypothetical protein
MRISLVFIVCLNAALLGCGDSRTEYGPAGEVRAYLAELRLVLQELRALDLRVANQLSGDSIAMSHIIPLIQNDFRPTLIKQFKRVSQLRHPPELEQLDSLVKQYLQTRLSAYDIALKGEREKRYELFAEFSSLQEEADGMRPILEAEILKVRQAASGH